MIRKGHEYTGDLRWPDAQLVQTNHENPLLVGLAHDTARKNTEEIRRIVGMMEKYFLGV